MSFPQSIDDFIPEQFKLLDTISSYSKNFVYFCNHCHSKLFDNTSSAGVQEDQIQKLLSNHLLIKEVHCIACSGLIGFRIKNFIPDQYGYIYETQKVSGLKDFKNFLLCLENGILEKQRYSKFVKINKRYIDKYFICVTNITTNSKSLS
ncbi:conserved hypothetical protein [Candida dubliniensis CD36]|uniref:Protein yippee-like n=1 Tax=Candida dubliniensis (strain CD36 / ATCC MYA-646 / CBS 7987 / NCPF 3949 / NRRL Y-17841) TaxID=573826 RepID=B9WF57_CANDC|nr:conserved hypothetical protein [Candida dubliniensis CD36]CAX42513.1 conserved hypothetical protein [Candida dubliniensis CD36]